MKIIKEDKLYRLTESGGIFYLNPLKKETNALAVYSPYSKTLHLNGYSIINVEQNQAVNYMWWFKQSIYKKYLAGQLPF